MVTIVTWGSVRSNSSPKEWWMTTYMTLCFGMYVCTYVMHVVSRINYGKSQATDNALGSCCASLSPSEEAESHTEFTERASSS